MIYCCGPGGGLGDPGSGGGLPRGGFRTHNGSGTVLCSAPIVWLAATSNGNSR